MTADEQEDRRADELLGAIIRIMMSTNALSLTIADVRDRLLTPVLLRQARVWRNLRGEPLGYACWAYLAPDVASRIRTTHRTALHFSEWNEGLEPWVMEFAALSGRAYSLARDLRRSVFADAGDVFACLPGRSPRRAGPGSPASPPQAGPGR